MSPARALILVSLAALAHSACITPTRAGAARYFEPHSDEAPPAQAPDRPLGPALHLARVHAPAHLGQPMVWRRSPVELAFDEQNRWAAEPAAQVEQALRRALFLHGPYAPRQGRGSALLEVHLRAYEGHLERDPLARVALVATLSTDASARTRSFSATSPLERAEPAALAHGVGRALDEALALVGAWLADELAPQ